MAFDFSSNVIATLQAKQLLTSEQIQDIQQAAAQAGADVVKTLVEKRLVTSEDLAKAKAEILNIAYIDLTSEQIIPDVLKIIPQDLAENYHVVPFALENDIVSVAFENPEDYRAIEALDFIGRQKKLRFKYYCATEFSIKHVLRQYGNLTAEVEEALATADADSIELDQADVSGPVEEVVKTAPVSKMISVILKHAIEGKSSDVHIEPVKEETRVRYRVDGILHTSLVLPIKVHNALVARIKVLASLKLDETRLPQDGRFKMKYEGRDIEFRVSTLPLLDNEKVVMRILDTTASVLSLEQLGFQDRNLRKIQESLRKPHGMLLVTGPTGSGKSTSLYSMLTMLNKEGVNIITLEDPVEYNLLGISQSQMKPEIGLTFAKGLRSVLRQDPDIIMVGEIRDAETAELAVHAALTGHMMLSTLHTNNAFGAIPRLIDLNIEPFLISSSLNMVIAQRLVRKLCQECKQETHLDKMQIKDITNEVAHMPKKFLPNDVTLLPPYKAYKNVGCNHCEHTGYHGRVAINEVLENTKELSEIIGAGNAMNLTIVQKEFDRQGVFSLRQDGLIKVFRGLTTLEEVWNATKE